MNKKISLGAALAFALIVAAAVFSVTMVYSQKQYNTTMSSLRERESMYKKLSEIDRNVREEYYDAAAINQTELQDKIAKGYMDGIRDPYAKYYSAAEYAEYVKEQEGSELVGIGAALGIGPDGYLIIEEVYPDSPAQVARLAEGDTIIKLEDTDITSENSKEMLEKIKGPDGSKLLLTVRKNSEDIPVELTRRSVAVPTVYSRYIPGGVGYIQLTAFDASTANQFTRHLRALEEQGIQALIFDLRDNKSQSLESATRILDRLVPAGPIANVVDKDGTVQEVETSDTQELNIPMVTIVNGETSGAAELFSLVLRDYGKSTIVGTQTAGQGIRQEMIKLSDGSAIEITVALYQSPEGEIYHEVGVKPDYDVELPGGVEDWSQLTSDHDSQYQKALELLSTTLRKDGTYNEEEAQEAIKAGELETAGQAKDSTPAEGTEAVEDSQDEGVEISVAEESAEETESSEEPSEESSEESSEAE